MPKSIAPPRKWYANAVTLAIVFATLSGCSTGISERPDSESVVGLSTTQRSDNGRSFAFDADVSMRATTVAERPRTGARMGALAASNANGRSIQAAPLDYHISYAEYGERVVVDITPPSSENVKYPRHSMWTSLLRIRMSSDARYPELTLRNGRVIRGDVSMFGGDDNSSRTSLENPLVAATNAQRANALRGKISSFLRLRTGSTGRRFDFATNAGADTTEAISQAWVQLNDEFDVVTHRTITPAAQSSGSGMRLVLDVSKVVIAGTPSILP